MCTAVYSSDDDRAPDSAYTPGELGHLVAGNRGRLLDARRTPITVIDVAPDRGAFVVGIDAFEDAGAQWDLWLGDVARFQFTREAATASAAELAVLERSLARFDRELVVECDPAVREDSLARVAERRQRVRVWLEDRPGAATGDVDGHIHRRDGYAALYGLLDEFLAEHELAELEERFTATLVTNPGSGEVVTGHAIVLAELGLCPYRGRSPRDPELFAGVWSAGRRAEHLLWRLAFTQELLERLGATSLSLYRAAATDGPLPPPTPSSFVSASFSRAVAEAHFQGGPSTRTAVLCRQVVPVARVLMTFLETRAMNARFHEAEAVLLGDPDNRAF